MSFEFKDRVSTYPNRYKVTKADGTFEHVTLERADEPTAIGTPLNAATFNKAFGDIEVDLTGYATEEFVETYVAENAGKDDLTPKAGFIYPLASSVVPEGFLLCDGAAYARAEYPELFAAIGSMYGEGDGSTTFNVPNLATRVPVGAGENYGLGDVGGEETHTLTVDEIPSHRHESPDNAAGLFEGWGNKSDGGWLTPSKQGTNGGNWRTAFVGNDHPHNNMQPYTVVNYIIATGKDTGVSVQDVILGAQALPLGVEYGGTGATNAEDARKNLGLNDTYNYADNSDFTQFIAQAGIGDKHGNQAYAGDRWILDSGTVTGEANENGNGYSNIQLNGTIRQIIANPPAVGSVFVDMVTGTAEAVYENGAVTITSNGGVIRNVLLCEGQYTEANRPKYQPKGYTAELLECKRYFARFKEYEIVGNGIVGYAAGLDIIVPYPVMMRVKPSWYGNTNASVVCKGQWLSLTTKPSSITILQNALKLSWADGTFDSSYASYPCMLRNQAGGGFSLSADFPED